jgi:transcriptional/translational regulatory protein YebC/TACO1
MHEPLAQHICHEGYGPGGTAVILTCSAEADVPAALVRAVFAEHGGRRGARGSVSYLFRKVGALRVRADGALGDRAAALGVEEQVASGEGLADLLMDPRERASIEARLRRRGYECLARGSGWRAMHRISPPLPEARKLEELVRRLAAIDGVGHVYTNAQTTDQLLAPV